MPIPLIVPALIAAAYFATRDTMNATTATPNPSAPGPKAANWTSDNDLIDDGAVMVVAGAIGTIEGINVKGSIPATHNNPGDITASKKGIIQFPTLDAGYIALYNFLVKIALGNEPNYTPDMSWRQFGWKYVNGTPAPGDLVNGAPYTPKLTHSTDAPEAWISFVTGKAGVSPEDIIGDYLLA